jgi:uncharacterized membrane protein
MVSGGGLRWPANIKLHLRKLFFLHTAVNYTANDLSDRKEFFLGPVTFRRCPPNLSLSISHRDADREVIMNRPLLAASALTTAVGLALATQAPTVRAQGMANPPQVVKDNMARMEKDKLQKCYGINAVAKNDCAEGAQSCAGQATQARDPKSFVLLPAGDCSKIQGGRPTAS